MLRMRLLRILFPLLLVVLGWFVWQSWHAPTPPTIVPGGVEDPLVEVIEVAEWIGEGQSIRGSADLVKELAAGALHLEGIRDLEIARPERGPLVVSAGRGDRTAENGGSTWDFEDGVVFLDRDEGLELQLPSLEIDEEAGEARSQGKIRFLGPSLEGSATGIVYGLRGQPGSVTKPVLQLKTGGSVSADRGVLIDGVRDVELLGGVRAQRGDELIQAHRVRLIRGDGDRLRRAEASGSVAGTWPVNGGEPAGVLAERLEIRWDRLGEVERLWLEGNATVERSAQRLSAARIVAVSNGTAAGWEVRADEQVEISGRAGPDAGVLTAERVEAWLSPGLVLQSGEASGNVRFDGPETSAEANRATFQSTIPGVDGTIRLFGNDQRKARLAHGRIRIAAEWIQTDAQGRQLVAERRLEASLLPGTGPVTRAGHLFASEDAVHFVADKLESRDAGARLEFHGSVRAWQGERNLSADEITVDQKSGALAAHRGVTTRVPRATDRVAVSEADYLQIESDDLNYDDGAAQAVYTGNVRVRLVEGWLKSDRVEIDFTSPGREIQQVRAFGSVRMEVLRTVERALTDPFSGEADRLVYDPADETLRLYGDDSPAAVRQGGGTTAGRVLRYRLDLGSIEVDSGDQGPATIRTSAG